jgi:hypothetical protein
LPICRGNTNRAVLIRRKRNNACGIYRTRIATFTSGCDDDTARTLGPLFAAAPDVLAALRPLVAIVNGANVAPAKREQYLDAARAAIAEAEGKS